MTKGTIEFAGTPIDKTHAAEVVKPGIIQGMEGRGIVEHLTAEDNLHTGPYTRNNREISRHLEMVYGDFPP